MQSRDDGNAFFDAMCRAQSAPPITFIEWLKFTLALICAASSAFYICAYLFTFISWQFPQIRGGAARQSTHQPKEDTTL